VGELLSGMAWSGFARKERDNKTSSLTRLASGEATLNSAVSIREATGHGIAPAFTDTGLLRPEQVELVTAGRAADSLVSMRSAAEFGEVANAGAGESPEALVLDGGNLDTGDAMQALDTGIWIANLWYLNYSDRPNGRMTGMTRFACFWVENGKLVAPISPIRFDESLLRLFGDKLVALTRQTDFMPDPSTWGARQLSSITAPGMLVDGMTFTL
jgi:predicted Zn-dependent protease